MPLRYRGDAGAGRRRGRRPLDRRSGAGRAAVARRAGRRPPTTPAPSPAATTEATARRATADASRRRAGRPDEGERSPRSGGPRPTTWRVTIADVVDSRWAVVDEDDGATRAARWRDVAVLLPARTALAALEEALEEARIPYRLEGVALLWGSDEVRDVLAVLRAVDDPVDRVAVLGALRSPGLACGDDDLVTWRQAEGTLGPAPARAPGPRGPPRGVGHGRPGPAARRAVVARAVGHGGRAPSTSCAASSSASPTTGPATTGSGCAGSWTRPGSSTRRWAGRCGRSCAWAELQAEDDRRSGGVGPPDPDDDAVRVMTIHGSKGLEFPVVVLAGLERDVASGAAGPDRAVDARTGARSCAAVGRCARSASTRPTRVSASSTASKQHRLLYVGMTRARDHLVVCLHHKQLKETATATPTDGRPAPGHLPAASPQLWRRLPIAALTPTDVADDEGAAAEAA